MLNPTAEPSWSLRWLFLGGGGGERSWKRNESRQIPSCCTHIFSSSHLAKMRYMWMRNVVNLSGFPSPDRELFTEYDLPPYEFNVLVKRRRGGEGGGEGEPRYVCACESSIDTGGWIWISAVESARKEPPVPALIRSASLADSSWAVNGRVVIRRGPWDRSHM